MLTAVETGQRVREARAERGWKQRYLARRVGVSKDVIYRLEKGKVIPPTDVIRRIASELDTTVEALLAPSPGTRKAKAPASRPRLRVASQELQDDQVEMPVIVAQLLMTGRLGQVTASELSALIANSQDPAFANDLNLLELECLWRRACGAMHKPEHKKAVDDAFERIRQDLARHT